MASERRLTERFPVGFYARQLVDDEPLRCFTTNLSASGLYMERIHTPLGRRSNTVQLEIPLPGESDTLWMRGEIVYDCFDSFFHGTAVRFGAMARGHRRMLREWLAEAASKTFGHGQVIRAANGIDIFRPPPRAGARWRARRSAFGLPNRN